jgi:glycosyltransferase involved in cell wall biosynthesis
MKVLFITPVPREAAAYRVRIEQYLPYLAKHGITGDIRPFISSKFFAMVYNPGRYGQKIRYFFEGAFGRIKDLVQSGQYDLIFIFREAFPFGPPFTEWLFYKTHKPVVYDFDDAIYLPNTSSANRMVGFLKYPQKVSQIIKMSAHIIVCNDFLKEYAERFSGRVTVVPTSVDTDVFKPAAQKASDKKPIVGWIGSPSTAIYLNQLRVVFQELAKRYAFTLKIIGAGSEFKIPGVDVINREWELEKEVGDFQGLDIGVYPLPDTEWVKGKTGFKTVQYMSVGVPCVVSRVGRNLEIVKDGEDGFLASSDDEWIERLSLLMDNRELRRKMGQAGRATVESRYSLKASAPKLLEVLTCVKP